MWTRNDNRGACTEVRVLDRLYNVCLTVVCVAVRNNGGLRPRPTNIVARELSIDYKTQPSSTLLCVILCLVCLLSSLLCNSGKRRWCLKREFYTIVSIHSIALYCYRAFPCLRLSMPPTVCACNGRDVNETLRSQDRDYIPVYWCGQTGQSSA